MPRSRSDVASAIGRARGDLDKALARLESVADDDRQRVAYSVHALNNYLMVVSTTLALLQTKMALRGDRDVRRLLDALKQATNLMMSTARGVLTARSDEPLPLLLESNCLTEIADGVCQAYRDIARRKRVRITWKAPATRDRVVTDSVAAAAVLDNLLSNAVKYSEEGTIVQVIMSIVAGEVVCSVRDRGPGLSEADQLRLFQRGVRLTAQPTAGEASSGYGLSIANDLALALGGRLSCVSVLGEGSCFAFSLPLAEERRLESETPADFADSSRVVLH